MKRRVIFSVLCALLCLTAVSQYTGAAECFGNSFADVFPDHGTVDAMLDHFNDGTGQSMDPPWEYCDVHTRWECDMTQNPPAVIPISMHTRFHDNCNPVQTAEARGWARLTVTQVGVGQQPQVDQQFTPNHPLFYQCDGSVHVFFDASLGPINVAGQQGNDYWVLIEVCLDTGGGNIIQDSAFGLLET